MDNIISYPNKPTGLDDWDHYTAIKSNWEYSKRKLTSLSRALHENLVGKKLNTLSVVVAGSFGRMDANENADLDYMILSDEHNDENNINKLIEDFATDEKIKLPNPTGVFSVTIPTRELIENTGSRNDSMECVAQRMLLLMESRALFNETYFRSTVDRLLRKYLDLVIADTRKEALFFLNDIIRYFRSICVNYHFNFWKEEDKWVIRNIKLRHSRIIMYAGLLLLVLNASKYRGRSTNKYDYIVSKIFLTPIEKIISVYQDNNDPNLYKILEIYDVFLRKIYQPEIRSSLRIDYETRYENPEYQIMKVTSDSLQSELLRFILSRKGVWTDQVYEYLIF